MATQHINRHDFLGRGDFSTCGAWDEQRLGRWSMEALLLTEQRCLEVTEMWIVTTNFWIYIIIYIYMYIFTYTLYIYIYMIHKGWFDICIYIYIDTCDIYIYRYIHAVFMVVYVMAKQGNSGRIVARILRSGDLFDGTPPPPPPQLLPQPQLLRIFILMQLDLSWFRFSNFFNFKLILST